MESSHSLDVDGSRATDRREHPGVEALVERGGHVRPTAAALAGDHHGLRIEHHGNRSQRLAEGGAGGGVDLQRRPVAGGGSGSEILRAGIRAEDAAAAGCSDQGRLCGDRLQAAPLAAGAQSVAAGVDVAELAGRTAGSAVELAVDDDAHPDAAAERDGEKVIEAAADSVEALGHGERVDVVVDQHRDAERPGEVLAEGQVAPPEQRRLHHARPVGVLEAGQTKPDAEQQLAGARRGDMRFEQLGEHGEGVAGHSVERHRGARRHRAVQLGAHDGEVVVGHLGADRHRRRSHQPQQFGRTPTTRYGLLDRRDDASLDQIAGQGRDRPRADTDLAGDVRPRDGSVASDQPQHGTAVDVPQRGPRRPLPHQSTPDVADLL